MIGLSTASVYPESTAHAFELRRPPRLRRRRGDGRHRRAQPADRRVQQLADYHELPVLRDPRAAACCSPSGSGAPTRGASSSAAPRWRTASARTWSSYTRRSAGSASTPPGSSTASPRWRSRPASLRGREHVSVARSAVADVETYLPGWDPSEEDLRQRHPRPVARRDGRAGRGRDGRDGSATGCSHVHLTDGSGSAKDEHLVPGRGTQRAADLLGTLANQASAVTSCSRSTPAGRPRARSARPTWSSRWSSPASTSSGVPPAVRRSRSPRKVRSRS